MENTAFTTLTRQAGLMREMQIVANNIANIATTGYRQEGLIFSEYVQRVDHGPSVSMANGNVRQTSLVQGGLTQTDNTFDFAIEGDGFFLIQTPQGERLSRNGSFAASAAGDLVTNDGFPVLDAGGAPMFVPPGARQIKAAADGTLSADGQPIGQIGIVRPTDPLGLRREDGVMFDAEDGFASHPARTASMRAAARGPKPTNGSRSRWPSIVSAATSAVSASSHRPSRARSSASSRRRVGS